jgi:hypothetical protein
MHQALINQQIKFYSLDSLLITIQIKLKFYNFSSAYI